MYTYKNCNCTNYLQCKRYKLVLLIKWPCQSVEGYKYCHHLHMSVNPCNELIDGNQYRRSCAILRATIVSSIFKIQDECNFVQLAKSNDMCRVMFLFKKLKKYWFNGCQNGAVWWAVLHYIPSGEGRYNCLLNLQILAVAAGMTGVRNSWDNAIPLRATMSRIRKWGDLWIFIGEFIVIIQLDMMRNAGIPWGHLISTRKLRSR